MISVPILAISISITVAIPVVTTVSILYFKIIQDVTDVFHLSILIFSLWAGFALLIVNPIMNADLPQYVIGRICIWDYTAMALAIMCSFLFTVADSGDAIDVLLARGRICHSAAARAPGAELATVHTPEYK